MNWYNVWVSVRGCCYDGNGNKNFVLVYAASAEDAREKALLERNVTAAHGVWVG